MAWPRRMRPAVRIPGRPCSTGRQGMNRALPAEPGSYVLFVDLDPGGIRARDARHLRADKAARWHVNRLTAAVPADFDARSVASA